MYNSYRGKLMKRTFNKHFIIVTSIFAILTGLIVGYAPINANSKAPDTKAATTELLPPNAQKYEIATTPLIIVGSPSNYLNKDVKFKATFDKFSGLGLDYKPAMKSSQDYIGILIKRDDIKDHTIPLSEMKLFLKRSEAEKYVDLETGDLIEIHGKVFSNALGDPWIDIQKFVVLTQKEKKPAKK